VITHGTIETSAAVSSPSSCFVSTPPSSKKLPLAIEVYSGAGGLTEGFLNAGFDVALSVEKDRWAVETQRVNHSAKGVAVVQADMTDPATLPLVREHILKDGRELTVLFGGPPCQGFSKSNSQTRSRSNPNNQHVFTFVNFVRELQPQMFLMENVAGLALFEDGDFVNEVVAAFEKEGYRVDVAILNAAEFGVPQTRRRIFFLGNRIGILNFFPAVRLPQSKWTTVSQAISDLPCLTVGYAGGPLNYAPSRPSFYAQEMRRDSSGIVDNNWVSNSTDLIVERYKTIPQGGNWRDIPEHLMQNYADKSRCHQWIYRRLDANKPAVVITNFRKSMLIHPLENRGLSVREAARLQSFPDTFIFKGSIEFQQQQVANAVPPLLAQAVASSIMDRMIASKTPVAALSWIAPDLISTIKVIEQPRGNLVYFRSRLLQWSRKNGRHFPWRIQPSTPHYYVLISEILLQKTTANQVASVFKTILDLCPTLEDLAKVNLERLRRVIVSLGMPTRAARLKQAAQYLILHYKGQIPKDRKDLALLPGVGPYVAAAIGCFAHKQPYPLVDSNVVRVFERFFGILSLFNRPRNDPLLWKFAGSIVPKSDPDLYSRALVDFGAMVCTHHQPHCAGCPIRAKCATYHRNTARGEFQPQSLSKPVDKLQTVPSH